MKEFWTDERAVTPTEYALLAAFVSLMMAGVLALTGKNMSGLFQRVANSMGEAATSAKNAPGY